MPVFVPLRKGLQQLPLIKLSESHKKDYQLMLAVSNQSKIKNVVCNYHYSRNCLSIRAETRAFKCGNYYANGYQGRKRNVQQSNFTTEGSFRLRFQKHKHVSESASTKNQNVWLEQRRRRHHPHQG